MLAKLLAVPGVLAITGLLASSGLLANPIFLTDPRFLANLGLLANPIFLTDPRFLANLGLLANPVFLSDPRFLANLGLLANPIFLPDPWLLAVSGLLDNPGFLADPGRLSNLRLLTAPGLLTVTRPRAILVTVFAMQALVLLALLAITLTDLRTVEIARRQPWLIALLMFLVMTPGFATIHPDLHPVPGHHHQVRRQPVGAKPAPPVVVPVVAATDVVVDPHARVVVVVVRVPAIDMGRGRRMAVWLYLATGQAAGQRQGQGGCGHRFDDSGIHERLPKTGYPLALTNNVLTRQRLTGR